MNRFLRSDTYILYYYYYRETVNAFCTTTYLKTNTDGQQTRESAPSRSFSFPLDLMYPIQRTMLHARLYSFLLNLCLDYCQHESICKTSMSVFLGVATPQILILYHKYWNRVRQHNVKEYTYLC